MRSLLSLLRMLVIHCEAVDTAVGVSHEQRPPFTIKANVTHANTNTNTTARTSSWT
jgi:hypothetical protein